MKEATEAMTNHPGEWTIILACIIAVGVLIFVLWIADSKNKKRRPRGPYNFTGKGNFTYDDSDVSKRYFDEDLGI